MLQNFVFSSHSRELFHGGAQIVAVLVKVTASYGDRIHGGAQIVAVLVKVTASYGDRIDWSGCPGV
jgi:hypothetical protein